MTWSEERLARLQLARTSGIGPLTMQMLLEQYNSAVEARQALPDRARKAGRRNLVLASLPDIENEIQRTEAFGACIRFPDDDDFPTLLASLSTPPSVISCKGELSIARKSVLAIVGARNASAAAMRIARDIAFDLGQSGWVVASGLARGVDTAAHNGALEHGTIAVIAGGIDNIYPPQNEDLYLKIADQGLIISESAFGHAPRAQDFPRRNRLITGISYGVVVVEAAMKSGSLISARTALEQGREVMAVPGSPLDPRTRGSNGLIRSGAVLVESADHILDCLSPMQPMQADLFRDVDESPFDNDAFTPDETDLARLESLLSPVPVSISDLATAAQLSVRICAMLLIELELSGKVRSLPGGMVKRTL